MAPDRKEPDGPDTPGQDAPTATATAETIEHALCGLPFFIISEEDYYILRALHGRPLDEIREQIERISDPVVKNRLLQGQNNTVVAVAHDDKRAHLNKSPMDRIVFGRKKIVYTSAVGSYLNFFTFKFANDQQGRQCIYYTSHADSERVTLPEIAHTADEEATLKRNLRDAGDQLTAATERVRSLTRRRWLELVGAGLVGAIVSMATSPQGPVRSFSDRVPLPDILRTKTPETGVERLRDLPGLEAILAASLREKDTERGTQKDNLIDPFTVLRQFLGGKFWYTGRAKDGKTMTEKSPYSGQRVHRFAIIGERSKYLDRNGEGKDRFNKTTLSDAINNLLDYERLNDEEIKQWIAFTYKHSFRVENLQADRITIQRNRKTKKIIWVSYNPQPGFERKLLLGVPKPIEGIAPGSMQAMPTTTRDYYSILGAGNRLILQSGVSPDHDLYVPANLLDTDKKFRMPIGKRRPHYKDGYGDFGSYELRASHIAKAIHWQEEKMEENGRARIEGHTKDGRQFSFKSVAPFVPKDNPIIKEVADFLIRTMTDADRQRYRAMGITDPKAQEIQRLTEFVQSMDYVWENDNDFNRHPLITLFNEGSDCNNKTILWSALLTARKLDHAILYIANRKYSHMSHVLGGIDASIIPPPAQNDTNNGVAKRFRHFAVVESTSSFSLGRTFERAEIEKEIAVAEWLHFDPAGNLQIDIVR